MDDIKRQIEEGSTFLGIEIGSTRIKSILMGEDFIPLAAGSFQWENQYIDGIWTYSLEDVWDGLRESYKNLSDCVRKRYGVIIKSMQGIGISAMMHGYLAFDRDGNLLVPFRTWRNGITETASDRLTNLFGFNIPQRWSIAHLYQAILNQEEHVKDIASLNTLSGYVHWKLTGRKVLGIGDASGMFPIDPEKKCYHEYMMKQFHELTEDYGFPWQAADILPEIAVAGEAAGYLTAEGARLLDPEGNLHAGIVFCAPEGDAGTGMIATNSVSRYTGNISAGTSIFAMAVLEKNLSGVYREIDMVTTPSGYPVAMVHANNCTSDLNAWVGLFEEFAETIGTNMNKNQLFSVLYGKALEADADCGGLLSYGYLSGENITGIDKGRPIFIRTPESRFNLANFMRCHLYASLGTIRIGMDILTEEEHVKLNQIMGHGGLFKTKGVAQRITAAAMETPVSVLETAGEGGAWGIALLAAYTVLQKKGESLEEFLEKRVFDRWSVSRIEPATEDVEGFRHFMRRYREGVEIEMSAGKYLN